MAIFLKYISVFAVQPGMMNIRGRRQQNHFMNEAGMEKIFFISDVHLGMETDAENEKESALLEFLDAIAKPGNRLFILGDLFEFWFEYNFVIPRRHFHILAKLDEIARRGVRIDYIIGNHDFWIDHFFEETLNITVHQHPLQTDIDGKRFFIAHGDGMAKSDRGYRLLKRILRNRFNIFLYRMIHPDLGFRLALFFSRLSRGQNNDNRFAEEYVSAAREQFQKGFDFVIFGHTHHPYQLREDHRLYINTGDWITHFSYAVFENGELNLMYWKEMSE